MSVPAVPEPGALRVDKVEGLATQLVAWSRDADMDEALDALKRAQAVETYLAKKKAKLEEPMLVAERHLERRIGELLGPANHGGDRRSNQVHRDELDTDGLQKVERANFRLISEHWAAVEKALPCSRAEAIKTARKAKKEKDETPPDDCTLEQWAALGAEDRERALTFIGGDKFNDQKNDNIEWALWSWNPVTGCLHNCPYCYARDIANRFYAEGFQPVLRPRRLTAPANTAVPTPTGDPIKDMGNRNVFTCSMADLFGKWVPEEWIETVLAQVRVNPQWNFLFLTKFPVRLAEFNFPDNAWVGTTVDCQARVKNAERSFRRVRAAVKWLSVEPMLEPLTFDDLGAFQWVVVGGASSGSKTPEWRPPRDWSDDLRRQAEAAGVGYYEKTNLLERIRQYPGLAQPPVELPKSLRYLPTLESV